jgi:hypothetical protein
MIGYLFLALMIGTFAATMIWQHYHHKWIDKMRFKAELTKKSLWKVCDEGWKNK